MRSTKEKSLLITINNTRSQRRHMIDEVYLDVVWRRIKYTQSRKKTKRLDMLINNITILVKYNLIINSVIIGLLIYLIFTALHVMQTRYCDEISVRLSVRHTRELWQNGRKIGPDLYTIRKNIQPSFLRRRMVGGERPILPEILGQPTPIWAKSPIFNQ